MPINILTNGVYIDRPLINAEQLSSWAKENGLTPVNNDEFHVTVCYSRAAFNPNGLDSSNLRVPFFSSNFEVKPLGDEGAIVVMFDCPELQARHSELKSLGATHDYPKYQPHVTISYNSPVPRGKIEAPLFDLVFGPERASQLEDNWSDGKNSDKPKPAHEEDWIEDPMTGEKRPKHQKPNERPKGVLPSFKSSINSSEYDDSIEVELNPKNWFLTQSTIMASLPMPKGSIPSELSPYVNGNFNTYPSSELNKYAEDFKQSLLFKNHNPRKAYGFTVDFKVRPVKVLEGKYTLNYVDILTAVNTNIDPDFAELIKDRTIKYMSWGHTLGYITCGICGHKYDGQDDDVCKHILQMVIRSTPRPAILGDKAYGLIHHHTEDFHVFDVSYLSEKPAYGGAISNTINILDKPLAIKVSPRLFVDKAVYASPQEKGIDPVNVIKDLFTELGLLE